MTRRQARRIIKLFQKASKRIVALPVYTQSRVAALHLVYYNEFKDLAAALGENIQVEEHDIYRTHYFTYRGFRVIWMEIL